MDTNRHESVSALLQQLGFSDHDSQVYLSVLQRGHPTTGHIVKDTGLHREQIYRSLSRLADQGVVVADGDQDKNRYKALDPKILVDLTDAKKKLAVTAEQALRQLFTGQSQSISVREGKDAMRFVADDILQTVQKDGEYLVLGGAWREFSHLAKEYLPHYHRQLQKRGIGGRILSYQGHDAQDEKTMGWHIQVRVLNEPSQNIASTVIYGDKVVIEILDPENIAAIVIQNKKVAEHYRQTFETLWKLAHE